MKNYEDFNNRLQEWKKLLNEYEFPAWDTLPSFDLYMDQVVALMSEYLKNFSHDENNSAFQITPPMINNYVKLKAMPAPQKKKYSKIHLSYLIMICSLKQTFSIPVIQQIIPLLNDEEDVKRMYTAFGNNVKKTFNYICDIFSSVTRPVINENDENNKQDFAVQTALTANIFKIIAEDLTSSAETTDDK